jgi:hypothetical protein
MPLPVSFQILGIFPYRLSHKVYIMQDNYIVYYSLQFSCLLASQTGNVQVFFKDSGKHGLIFPVAGKDNVFQPEP